MLQDYKHGNMLINGNRFKTINYQYDLISGKVNFVAYQPGKKDAFYHRYSYDSENRLTNVETSHDSIYWENEAWYEYYKHGPLARAVIGQQQVQGIDYAYTLQGWLKGINSTALTPSFDMGGDGASGSQVAKDAFGFGIHYFGNREYTPVSNSVKPFAAAVGNSPLFNGNISAISQSISTLGTPLEYTYSYDVLNRLTGMVANKGLDSLNNSWTNAFTALSDFKEAVTYDGNGNILTYNRNGNKTFAGSPLGMDSLTYHYRPGTNKLSYVTDLVRGANYGNDIDNQSIGNYKYDSIGNMVSDVRAGVDSIKWNVYGKIARIYKHDSTSIVYAYDAAGNRISKSVISKTNDTVQTFYVRDATGNILSTYTYRDTSVNSGQLSQIEANLYGSSRLGMTTLATNVQDATPTPTTSIIGLGYGENITFTRGKKFFELTNHLGNVLATVSDRKIGVSLDSSRISSYNPVINSAQEYYPFGMLMPGRGGHIATGRNFSGSTVVMYGDTIPATLTVTQRSNNTPGTYMATQTISFEGEFSSGTADEFTTLFVDQTSADPGTESGISYGIAAKGYRYGFNGKENDNEVKGEGNEQDYGMRVYDPGLGKFLSVDPLTKKFPHYTPYQFSGNTPIQATDQDGAETFLEQFHFSKRQYAEFQIARAKWLAEEEQKRRNIVLMADIYGNGHIGSEAVVKDQLAYIKDEHDEAVASAIIQGPFGSFGFLLGGDQSALKWSVVDGTMMSFSGIPVGKSSVFPSTINVSERSSISTNGVEMPATIRPIGVNISNIESTDGVEVPGRVQSRINITNKGWKHVLDRHFSGRRNASQFTITPEMLSSLLYQVRKSPVIRTTTAIEDGKKVLRFIRQIEFNSPIGYDKFKNWELTSTMTVMTNINGDLITATPGTVK